MADDASVSTTPASSIHHPPLSHSLSLSGGLAVVMFVYVCVCWCLCVACERASTAKTSTPRASCLFIACPFHSSGERESHAAEVMVLCLPLIQYAHATERERPETRNFASARYLHQSIKQGAAGAAHTRNNVIYKHQQRSGSSVESRVDRCRPVFFLQFITN